MNTPHPDPLAGHLATLDVAALRRTFLDQDELLVIENFLPQATLQGLLDVLPALAPRINRNYLPGHKKGGSVSRFDLDAHAPAFPALYQHPALKQFFNALTQAKLLACPASDPHSYALYYYTEAGDHIGYHYDTSYYQGSRYTVLIGLVDRSSCQLEYQLYKDNPARETQTLVTKLKPGALMIFNGDRLYHRVTPSLAGEERIALTLEYLTNTHMHPLARLYSNLKDAVAYFGIRQVFGRKKRPASGSARG